MLDEFCSKFHTLSSSAKMFKIGQDLTKLYTVKRWELLLRHTVEDPRYRAYLHIEIGTELLPARCIRLILFALRRFPNVTFTFHSNRPLDDL